MLNGILFVTVIFVTRIALPICATLFLGSVIERALKQGTGAA